MFALQASSAVWYTALRDFCYELAALAASFFTSVSINPLTKAQTIMSSIANSGKLRGVELGKTKRSFAPTRVIRLVTFL